MITKTCAPTRQIVARTGATLGMMCTKNN
jgi:hypothetical protein